MRRLQRIPLHLQRDSVGRGHKTLRSSSSATRICQPRSILQSSLHPRKCSSLGLNRFSETTNGALLCRRYFASRAPNEFDGIVPAAYRNYNEDRQRGSLHPVNINAENNSRRKEKRSTSFRQRKRNQGRKHGSSDDPLKKKIISLQLMDVEMANMVKDYEEKLGRPAFYQNTFDDMERNFGSLSQHRTVQKEQKKEWARKFAFTTDGQLSLVQTEKDYAKLCLTLRQLIRKWSTINTKSPRFIAQCLSTGEHQSGSRVTLSSLPAENAFNYTVMLESLRKQRAELIYTELVDDGTRNQKQIKFQPANRMFTWLKEKVNSFITSDGTNIAKRNVNLKNVKDLTAHISPKYTTNNSHYNMIMRSFIQSNADASNKDETMEAILSFMNHSVEGGNPNCIPDRRIYHIPMKYYQNNPTLKKSKKSFDFLKEMIQNRKENMDQAYHPSRHSYNIVLSSLRNAVTGMKDPKEKIEASTYAEMILDEIESDESVWNDESIASSFTTVDVDNDNEESSSLLQASPMPYQVSLQIIWEIGQENLEDYFERIDKIIIRMIGEEAYNDLYKNVNADLPKNMDSKTLVELTYYLSAGNREQVDKAKVLLFKMHRARNQSLTDEGFWSSKHPDHRSYNTVVGGIIYSTEKQRRKRRGKNYLQQDQLKKDALYATRLLDEMIENEYSMPTIITFYRLLRLWSMCKSKESGERAEEILSRMNIHACSSPKFSDQSDLLIRLHTCAIDCWHASVNAECPGAVKRAALLVERITSQNENLSMFPEQTENDSSLESRKGIGYLYTSLLRCCAENSLDQDKADALETAFDTYNKILEENIPLTPMMFTLLLQCCSFAPNPQKQRNLSQKVFDSACAHGLASDRLLKVLKQINLNLYQSYTKDPEHSINIIQPWNQK